MSISRKLVVLVPGIMLAFSAAQTAKAASTVTYDATADFEQGWTAQHNPNGVWSYGYSSGFTTPITLYNTTVDTTFSSNSFHAWVAPAVEIGGSPAAALNVGSAFNNGNLDILANQLVLGSGIGGEYSDLVFTAPTGGTYSLTTSFRGDQYDVGTFVGVVANGSILFNSSVTADGQIVPFNTEISLKAGNTVVFSVGPDGGLQNTGISVTIVGPLPPPPSITSGGIVPADSTVSTIQPGEWVSIYGSNLAGSTANWSGNFPESIGGTSVTIDGKAAYLSFVSPTQIDLQAPNDTAVGSVPVVVTTASGTATATVTLAQFAPSFFLLDSKHVAGIIPRPDGSGAYGGGTYDILGPTGISLGYPTVAAKAGDVVELYGTGFGPTDPAVPAGRAFSGAAPATYPVTLLVNNVGVSPIFAGLSGAGLYQINLIVPTGLGKGDVPLVAFVASAGGAKTPPNIVISLQ